MGVATVLMWELILKPVWEGVLQTSAVAVLSRVRRRGLAPRAKELALALDGFSRSRIRPDSFAIPGIGRIPRPEITEIIDTWAGGVNGILLAGGAGIGKSGVAHHVAEHMRVRGAPVLFLDCSELSVAERPTSMLFSNLGVSEDSLIGSLRDLGAQITTYMIVDQLDSLTRAGSLISAVAFIRTVAAIPG